MSHIAEVKIEVQDLDCLKQAAETLGLEFVEGQSTYKWYGRSVGDYALPEGFTEQDLGLCDHAIRLPKGHPNWREKSYEIGVVKNKNGKGYRLLWDFWNQGYGLEPAVGKDAQKLIQQYGAKVAIKELRRAGFRTTVKTRQEVRH